jgi:hypothetical protein
VLLQLYTAQDIDTGGLSTGIRTQEAGLSALPVDGFGNINRNGD